MENELKVDPFENYFNSKYLNFLYNERGRKSAAVGRDGIRREKFQLNLLSEIELISQKCLEDTYHFTRYKERLIAKGPRQYPRQISIPTIRDRLALRALNDYLVRQAPNEKSELPHKYVREISSLISKCGPHLSFVRIDVKEFFPSIDHDILLAALKAYLLDPRATSLILGALRTPTGGPASQRTPNMIGVPQGLSISNILSSIYLSGFDRHSKAKYEHYWRYVDDILIVCPSHKAESIFKDAVIRLAEVKLIAHPFEEGSGKSDIVRMATGIDYLGYNLSSRRIKIRKSSYEKMFVNLMKAFTSFKYAKNKEKFVTKLNLKITGCIFEGKRKGWLFFFSQTEDMSQLRWLDVFVDKMRKKYAPRIKLAEIAKFTRTYHEIRYNFLASEYFPNFDTFEYEDKLRFLLLMTKFTQEELQKLNPQELDDLFLRTVEREVSVLEEDIQDTFS